MMDSVGVTPTLRGRAKNPPPPTTPPSPLGPKKRVLTGALAFMPIVTQAAVVKPQTITLKRSRPAGSV